MNNLKKFSIKQINKVISELIDNSFYILFEIKAIVYNLNIVDNNAYLTLKNKDYKLNAIIWNNIYEKNKEIKNKDIIICKAKLKYFEKKCKFFIIIEDYNIKKRINNKLSENKDIKQYINSIGLKKK